MDGAAINNRYRVIRDLARGGMGRVCLVEDTRLEDRRMALKTLLPHVTSPEFVERLRTEFAALAKLRHVNIAAAYDFGRVAETGEHFFTTEFIRGVDLYTGTVDATVDQLIDVVAQLLRGLEFIHSHGLLHNDLKPNNVLLERFDEGLPAGSLGNLSRLEATVYGSLGRVKLIDFGLLSAEGTSWEKILGTPYYMSPERIRCQPADRRSDLYSAGVLLYTVCTRVPPFHSEDQQLLLQMHLESPVPSLAARRQDFPDYLVRLIEKLLAKAPENRFESADAGLRFLERARSEQSPSEIRPRTAAISTGSLFHRQEELSLLEASFRKAESRMLDVPCVVLEGPSGCGKSRLIEEVRRTVQVSGGAYVRIRPTDTQGHLGPVAAAVLQGLELSGASKLEELRTRLSGDEGEDIAGLLEKVLLAQSEELPILLAVDDVDVASGPVRSFVSGLLQTASDPSRGASGRPRLMIIVATSVKETAADLAAAGSLVVRVAPFPLDVAGAFIRRLFGQREVPREVIDQVIATTGGNPGFIFELARELVEKGVVRHDGGRWVFPASLAQIPLPTSLQGIAEKRVASLDKTPRSIVDWLACIPGWISIEVLRHCCGVEPEELRNCLNSMARIGLVFLEESIDGPPNAVTLAQPAVREFALSKLEAERSRFLHQRIAQAFEKVAGPSAAQDEAACEFLAHHWLEAGNTPGFLKYATTAAAALRRGGNFQLSADYHRRIVAAMTSDAAAKKVQSLARLSEMYELLWDLQASQSAVEDLLDLGKDLIQPSDKVALYRRLGCLQLASNANDRAREAFAHARRVLPSNASRWLEISLDAPEAWAAWFLGDREHAMQLLQQAEAGLASGIPVETKEKVLLLGAANHVAALQHQLGRLSRAAETYGLQLRLLEGLNLPQAEAATRCSLGSVFLDRGARDDSFLQLSQALTLAKQIGDRRTLCRARERLGEHHFRYGEAKSALLITQVGLQDAQALRHPTARANALRTLARIYHRAEQDRDALRVSREALEAHVKARDPLGVPLARVQLARLLAETRQFRESAQQTDEARAEAARHCLPLPQGLCHLLQAELAGTLSGRIDVRAVASACEIFQTSGYAHELCEARLLSVRAAIEEGDFFRGAQLLDAVRDIIAQSGSREHLARVRMLEALFELDRGNIEAARTRMAELEQEARNSVFPRIARQARDALRHLAPEESR